MFLKNSLWNKQWYYR